MCTCAHAQPRRHAQTTRTRSPNCPLTCINALDQQVVSEGVAGSSPVTHPMMTCA